MSHHKKHIGSLALNLYTDGYPNEFVLVREDVNRETKVMRLSVEEAHDLKFMIERLLLYVKA